MLTDTEIAILLRDENTYSEVISLKKKILKKDLSLLHIGDDDFVALVLMSPTIGIALANDSLSHFEQTSLLRKARTLSHGGFFHKKDPIIKSLNFLIENFKDWESGCYQLVKVILHNTLSDNKILYDDLKKPEYSTGEFEKDILNAPYIFIKLLTFLFLIGEDDILNIGMIHRIEYKKILTIGEELDLNNMPIFKSFCDAFTVID